MGVKTINNVCRLYYREEADIELPPMGQYATGICFVDEVHHAESEAMFQEIARECSLQVSCLPNDFLKLDDFLTKPTPCKNRYFIGGRCQQTDPSSVK